VRRITPIHHNQAGLVSITVTILFIMMISILTTSFAFLMRRESQQALDRQLSTQAFYAAESGINDAAAAAREGTDLSALTDCQTDPAGLSSSLDASNTFQYTCLLVDETPTSLAYDNISTDESTVVRLSAGGTSIARLRISWHAAGGYSDETNPNIFATNNQHHLPMFSFYSDSGVNTFAQHTGILRSTIIPVDGSFDRSELINGSQTLFLYPVGQADSGINTIAYRDNSQAREGVFLDGDCRAPNPTAPRYCSATITNLNNSLIYLRLISIYKASTVEIEAFDSSDQPLELSGSQLKVDVTGRANDVLRRIQVRLPQVSQYHYPEFALEAAEGICKRLVVMDTVFVDGSATNEESCRLTPN
jgi:hypothetical protein